MKKLILLFFTFVAVSASAQFYDANIIGVRGGFNASMLVADPADIKFVDRQAKLGWFVGVTDQILLDQRLPFYFETGLIMSNKGGGYKYVDKAESHVVRYGMTYLQIPLRINYHFVGNSFTIEPYFGLHCDFGLWGREVRKTEQPDSGRKKEVLDLYRDNGFRRNDVGLSLGVGGTWNDIYVGFGWETGFVNLAKAPKSKAYNSSMFQLVLGYNF